jgi:hypothetical protein
MKAGKNNRPVRGRTASRDDETFDASPENPTSANKPKDLRQSHALEVEHKLVYAHVGSLSQCAQQRF